MSRKLRIKLKLCTHTCAIVLYAFYSVSFTNSKIMRGLFLVHVVDMPAHGTGHARNNVPQTICRTNTVEHALHNCTQMHLRLLLRKYKLSCSYRNSTRTQLGMRTRISCLAPASQCVRKQSALRSLVRALY